MVWVANYFFGPKRQTKETVWFQTALYLFLLYRACAYACQFEALFSVNAMVYTQRAFPGGLANIPFLLNNYYSPLCGALAIAFLALLALIGLMRFGGYFARACLWLLVFNLNNYLYASLTAGDYLLNQLLFFNIFLHIPNSRSPFWNDAGTFLYHTALAGIKIQVCLVYFIAAWFKFADPAWLDGSAVYSIFQIPQYSNPLLMALPLWLCVALNYATMLYQLLFPFTIWLRIVKPYLLAFGIVQHLIIAFGMGLSGFGIEMLICYLLFLRYDDTHRVHAGISETGNAVNMKV